MKNISSQQFVLRGQSFQKGAVVSQIPENLNEEKLSVCGIKGFMVDELREFETETGESVQVNCAAVAALEINNSPVHVHATTTEIYVILQGSGKMFLGDKVVDVKKDNVIVIPPGTPHGLMSNNPNEAIKVLMTFSPGMAPIEHEAFRDETILCPSTSQKINEIG